MGRKVWGLITLPKRVLIIMEQGDLSAHAPIPLRAMLVVETKRGSLYSLRWRKIRGLLCGNFF